MHPFEYRDKLIKDAEEKNKEAQCRMDELIKCGCFQICMGIIKGPYTTSTTYFMSNGEMFTIISPSSLHWVPMPFNC